jgi:plastocyanin
MSRIRLIATVVAAAALVGAGCGSDDDGSSGGSSSSSSASSSGGTSAGGGAVKISETDFKLDPSSAKVDKAGKATFKVTNDGKPVHALEVEGPGEEAETESIDPGKSATLTVDLSKAGTYEMYCPIGNHKAMGMEGKVVVAGGGSGSSASSGSDDDGSEDKGSDDDSGGNGGGGY